MNATHAIGKPPIIGYESVSNGQYASSFGTDAKGLTPVVGFMIAMKR